MIKTIMICLGASLLTAQTAAAEEDLGIKLAPGYSATVFADDLGYIRHMAEGPDGWIYAALNRPKNEMGGVAFKDSNGDGKADKVQYFASKMRGTGIAVRKGYLYFGAREQVIRWKLSDEGLPQGDFEVIAGGLPKQRQHAAKSIAFDGDNHLYVNVGAPSNACMVEGRTKGSPGRVPCDILDEHGGIWQFEADTVGQSHMKDGVRYATGIRNAVAIAWNSSAKDLYLTMHGRDQLNAFFPEIFDKKQSAELPAEEFHRVKKDSNIGWPYSYYDQQKNARMVMPEYGGDGKQVTDRTDFATPLVAFPGHWAPNAMIFIDHEASPLKGGSLIAFHGSWNREPEPQAEGQVVYVPMNDKGEVTGPWQVIADGFGGSAFTGPSDAAYRPSGLLESSDGTLFIGSGQGGGRVWKVRYDAR